VTVHRNGCGGTHKLSASLTLVRTLDPTPTKLEPHSCQVASYAIATGALQLHPIVACATPAGVPLSVVLHGVREILRLRLPGLVSSVSGGFWLRAPERKPCLFDGLATPTKLLHPSRDRGFGDRRDWHGAEDPIDVTSDVGAVARQGGRPHAGEVVDVGVQPLGDGGDVTTDLSSSMIRSASSGLWSSSTVLKRSAAGRFSKVSERWRPSWRHSTR
jgi:hypothetical protein